MIAALSLIGMKILLQKVNYIFHNQIITVGMQL
jgi:hypothetical protein